MGAVSIDGAAHLSRPPPKRGRDKSVANSSSIIVSIKPLTFARICLDRIQPVVENIFFSRGGISRQGIISLGAGAPILLLGPAVDYAAFKFQPFRESTRCRLAFCAKFSRPRLR
jgi:hypothetical protein